MDQTVEREEHGKGRAHNRGCDQMRLFEHWNLDAVRDYDFTYQIEVQKPPRSLDRTKLCLKGSMISNRFSASTPTSVHLPAVVLPWLLKMKLRQETFAEDYILTPKLQHSVSDCVTSG